MNGTQSPESITDSMINSFILGELYRFNTPDNDDKEYQVMRHYHRALNKIKNAPEIIIQNNLRTDENAPIRAYTPEYIVERIENYEATRPHVQIAPKVKQNLQKIRKELTSKQKYYAPKPVPSDPQNVHDSGVNEGNKKIWQRLIEKNPGRVQSAEIISEIQKELHNNKNFTNNEHKLKNINEIIALMNKGYSNSTLGTTEDQILAQVWLRINSRENQKNKDSLRQAFYESLSDCMEKSYDGGWRSVCVSGRSNRILQTLTLLDEDPVLSEPVKTTEMLKNEVFGKTSNIIQNELKKYPIDAQKLYLESTNETKELEQLKENIKSKVETELRIIYPYLSESIMGEALMGI
jgi:hypothetical protein